MKLKMTVNNVKSIKNLVFELPLDTGLYAITGENASGKSTVVACAATVFFNMPMNEYFGRPQQPAEINFQLGDNKRGWKYDGTRWASISGRMAIKGFYEGSIIYGNRFRNTRFQIIRELTKVQKKDLLNADDFIKKNLGLILHNEEGHYENLYRLSNEAAKDKQISDVFFYEKENTLISQAQMSTGENLLVSILNSLNMRVQSRRDKLTPCLIFLDEIELALHASALRRLVDFLRELADEYNFTIYFSTHSLELIRGIKPQNIYYLQRYFDDSIEIINPCYAAFATRCLYDDDYGFDIIVLVEDDLAKRIVNKILQEKRLLSNKRVIVLPAGGWQNVIRLAEDIVGSKLLQNPTKVILILDGDIRDEVQSFRKKYKLLNAQVKINYLPIKSLEKYLKKHLVENVNHALYRELDDYLFQRLPLREIVKTYQGDDENGKALFGCIEQELRQLHKNTNDLIEIIYRFLVRTEATSLEEIASFLETNFE